MACFLPSSPTLNRQTEKTHSRRYTASEKHTFAHRCKHTNSAKHNKQRRKRTDTANTPTHKHNCTVDTPIGSQAHICDISFSNYPPFPLKYSLAYSQTGWISKLTFHLESWSAWQSLPSQNTFSPSLASVSLWFWPLGELCLAEVSLAWLPCSCSSRGSAALAACFTPRFAAFFQL